MSKSGRSLWLKSCHGPAGQLVFLTHYLDVQLTYFSLFVIWIKMNSLSTRPQPKLRGRRPHSFSIEFSPKFSPILAKILVIWIFYWIFAKFFTNFGDIFGELKKLVSFWVTKMSPILVTIIPPNFVLFLSPILVKISVIWWNWWVFKWRKFHQFWWQ